MKTPKILCRHHKYTKRYSKKENKYMYECVKCGKIVSDYSQFKEPPLACKFLSLFVRHSIDKTVYGLMDGTHCVYGLKANKKRCKNCDKRPSFKKGGDD